MAKGVGLAAVQERIRKSFLDVHHDQRTREQREADEEMLASIAPPKSGTEAVRQRIHEAFQRVHTDLSGREEEEQQQETVTSIDKNTTSIPSSTTEKQVSACFSAALRFSHITKHLSLRRDIHHCYTVEEPSESADTLIAQVLLQLEGR